tara:strand:- start:41 stop:793 length:753 start_codon:yes stop_codon:yes gene_type:complete
MQGSSLEGSTLSQPYEEMELRDRLWGVFTAPLGSFAAVLGREDWRDWCVPVLIACLMIMGGNYLTLAVVADMESPAVQEQLRDMSEVQQQQFLQFMEVYRAHGWAIIPLVEQSFYLALIGLVVLVFARFLFMGDMSLRQAFIVKGYASLVMAPEAIVRTGLILFMGKASVQLGPGILVSQEAAETFWGKVLMGINVFDLWQIWVIAVGMHVLANVAFKRTVVVLGMFWGMWIVGRAALEVAGSIMEAAPG